MNLHVPRKRVYAVMYYRNRKSGEVRYILLETPFEFQVFGFPGGSIGCRYSDFALLQYLPQRELLLFELHRELKEELGADWLGLEAFDDALKGSVSGPPVLWTETLKDGQPVANCATLFFVDVTKVMSIAVGATPESHGNWDELVARRVENASDPLFPTSDPREVKSVRCVSADELEELALTWQLWKPHVAFLGAPSGAPLELGGFPKGTFRSVKYDKHAPTFLEFMRHMKSLAGPPGGCAAARIPGCLAYPAPARMLSAAAEAVLGPADLDLGELRAAMRVSSPPTLAAKFVALLRIAAPDAFPSLHGVLSMCGVGGVYDAVVSASASASPEQTVAAIACCMELACLHPVFKLHGVTSSTVTDTVGRGLAEIARIAAGSGRISEAYAHLGPAAVYPVLSELADMLEAGGPFSPAAGAEPDSGALVPAAVAIGQVLAEDAVACRCYGRSCFCCSTALHWSPARCPRRAAVPCASARRASTSATYEKVAGRSDCSSWHCR